MNFPTAIRTGVAKWITFSGRASRSEYWWIILGVFVFAFVLLLAIFGIKYTIPDTRFGVVYVLIIPFLYLWLVATSAAIRRLHDLNLSGWWFGGFLLVDRLSDRLSEKHWVFDLIGILAALVLIAFFVRKGTTGPNRYGDDPRMDIPSVFE